MLHVLHVPLLVCIKCYTWVWDTLSVDPATEEALLRPGRGRVLRLAVDPKKEETLGSESE